MKNFCSDSTHYHCCEYLRHGHGALDPERADQDERFIIAGCGHEVYRGEYTFEWEDGGTLCPDCLEYKFEKLSLQEKARLLGCDWEMVT